MGKGGTIRFNYTRMHLLSERQCERRLFIHNFKHHQLTLVTSSSSADSDSCPNYETVKCAQFIANYGHLYATVRTCKMTYITYIC